MVNKSKEITQYVLGFCFDENRTSVALILKKKPEWQKGFYNGIGGKIELNELPHQAMRREFREETGTECNEWTHYCTMQGDGYNENGGFIVFVFYAILPDARFYAIQTNETEEIMKWPLSSLRNVQVIGNLSWLIPLALDKIRYIDYDIKVL